MVTQILYGSGLRLSEGLQLRVKDVDFGQRQLVIRNTKGREIPVTMLPTCLIEPLQAHLVTVRQLHRQDLDRGVCLSLSAVCIGAQVPTSAIAALIWQYVFPAERFSLRPA